MIIIQARAKINWTLDVLGKREDGYHELDTLLQSVSLHDRLTLESAEDLRLEIMPGGIARGARLRADERNLVLRAARALQKTSGIARGARMMLEKSIPVGAGMGGGSADAAAALAGLNRLWRLGYPPEALERIGLEIGADIPFCVRGGLQRARGVGERLTPMTPGRPLWLVVAQPCRGLSTRDVFGALRVGTVDASRRPDNDAAAAALRDGDAAALAAAMGNVLQPVAESLRPEIALCAERVAAQKPLKTQMTGSGSAVFGVFCSARAAREALAALRTWYRAAWMTRTQAEGLLVEEAGKGGKAFTIRH